MKVVTAAEVSILRCADVDDRKCACGARITVRWCEIGKGAVVACPACGRHFEAVRAGDAPTTGLSPVGALEPLPRAGR